MVQDNILNVREVGKLLRVNEDFVKKLIREGKLSHVNITKRKYMVLESQVNDFIVSNIMNKP